MYRNRNAPQPTSLMESLGCACIANHNSALIYILPIKRGHLFHDQILSCLLIVAKICFVLCVRLCVSRQKTVTCLTSPTPANMLSSSTKKLNTKLHKPKFPVTRLKEGNGGVRKKKERDAAAWSFLVPQTCWPSCKQVFQIANMDDSKALPFVLQR